MNIKMRLNKLEKQAKSLFTTNLSELTDKELEELQDKLDESLAKEIGWEKVNAFSDWIKRLPEEELEKLSNTNYLMSEMQRLGLG